MHKTCTSIENTFHGFFRCLVRNNSCRYTAFWEKLLALSQLTIYIFFETFHELQEPRCLPKSYTSQSGASSSETRPNQNTRYLPSSLASQSATSLLTQQLSQPISDVLSRGATQSAPSLLTQQLGQPISDVLLERHELPLVRGCNLGVQLRQVLLVGEGLLLQGGLPGHADTRR